MSQAAKASRISAGYAEIKKLIENASYTKLVKVTNKIINDDVQQLEAWHCKVIALIQMDQFSEAVFAINKAPNKVQLQFEAAYCLYRLNDVPAALTALDSAPDGTSLRVQELRAQIYYRLEQYNDCYGVYRELLRSTADDLDMERATNMAAVQVHRTAIKECEIPATPISGAPYEQWYNSGCAALAGGSLEQADTRLCESLKQCAALLREEGAGEEEVLQEQAIIRVQRGYALQLAGRDKEAASHYNAVLQHKVTDGALLAILHNNLATLNKDANVFDSRKKMKSTQLPELEHKLNSVQRHQLALNNAILAYHSQQPQQEDAGIERDCAALLQSSTNSNTRLSAALLLAASRARAGATDSAVAALHDYCRVDAENETIVRLAAAQIRLMKQDVSGGVTELQSLPARDRFRPGVVASIVTLLAAKKNKQLIAQTFKDATQYYINNKGALAPSSISSVLRRAAEQHLTEGDPRAAATALQQLRDIVKDDSFCLPALIGAYSQFDPEKAQELSREVQIPDEALAAIDGDALETSLGPKYFLKIAAKIEDKENTAPAVAKPGRVKARKKRRRPAPVPASAVAGQTPDPERWLPRWQRKTSTAGRRRRDKRKEGVGKGTQGGAGDNADKYDITKNPGQYKNSGPHQPTEPQGPRRNMPKRKNKKK